MSPGMKKNVRYVAIAFVIFYILSKPKQAAALVNNSFDNLGRAAEQLATFVSALG